MFSPPLNTPTKPTKLDYVGYVGYFFCSQNSYLVGYELA